MRDLLLLVASALLTDPGNVARASSLAPQEERGGAQEQKEEEQQETGQEQQEQEGKQEEKSEVEPPPFEQGEFPDVIGVGGGAGGRFGGRSSSTFRSSGPTGATRQLLKTLHRAHVALEGIPRDQWRQRCHAELGRRLALHPDAPAELRAAWSAAKSWSELLDALDDAAEAEDRALDDETVRFLERALLGALDDPFTMIMHGEEIFSMQALFQSVFPLMLGIDVEVDAEGRARLSFVMAGSDARAKGLRRGDQVLEIDGVPVDVERLEQTREKLQTAVHLKIHREGWDRPAELSLGTGLPGGSAHCRVDGDLGYLCYRMFDGTALQLRGRAQQLIEQGARGLILDLRGNPGGLIADGWALASLFLERGRLISELHVRQRDEIPLPPRLISTGAAFPEIPLVLLVDGSSASASELVGGALLDHRRALLVGSQTFGKGIGQAQLPLMPPRGSFEGDEALFSMMRQMDLLMVSCLRFDGPSGNNVHGVGLRPDLRATPTDPGPATLEARARWLGNERWLESLRSYQPDADEVARLREGQTPESLRALAQEHGAGAELDALTHTARIALAERIPELLACPGLDPALAKAVKALRVQLR